MTIQVRLFIKFQKGIRISVFMQTQNKSMPSDRRQKKTICVPPACVFFVGTLFYVHMEEVILCLVRHLVLLLQLRVPYLMHGSQKYC